MSSPKKDWHHMTFAERDEFKRAQGNPFAVSTYRCKYCRTIVDSNSRNGHLGRCGEVVRQRVSFARGCPVGEHFTAYEIGGKKVDENTEVAKTNGVQKRRGRTPSAVVAQKREWATQWIADNLDGVTVTKVVDAVMEKFGSSFSRTAASEILKANNPATANAEPKRGRPKKAPADTVKVVQNLTKDPDHGLPIGIGVDSNGSGNSTARLFELLGTLRQLGISGVIVEGKTYQVT